MARVHRLVVVALAASSAHGLDNGVAVTPPMGWNSYMSGIGGARSCMTHHDHAFSGHLYHCWHHHIAHAFTRSPLHITSSPPAHMHTPASLLLLPFASCPAVQCSIFCNARGHHFTEQPGVCNVRQDKSVNCCTFEHISLHSLHPRP